MRSSNVWICGAVAITLMHPRPRRPMRLPVCVRPSRRAPAWVRVQAPAQGTQPPRGQSKAARKETITGATGEAQLRQRVEQLEEQLVDMQVLVGTLESLARGGSGAPRGGGSSGASESARIDVLETQVRAMASQIEQLSQQGRQQSGRRDDGRLSRPASPFASQAAKGPPNRRPGRPVSDRSW